MQRVAVLSDVHANVPALRAVLADVRDADVDLVVFCGDLTWGAEPQATLDLVAELGERAVFVRGNAERMVLDMAGGTRAPERPRDSWMLGQHPPAALRALAGFRFNAVVDILGLGPVRFCHGSPRSDHELVTPATSEERFAALADGVAEHTIVTGHTHLQFDRRVAGRRSVNPGSVGLPYHEGAPGTAYWAVLGPDVALRQTGYDVQDAIDRGTRTGDPRADTIAELLLHPPAPAYITADAESLVFSD